MDFLLYFIFYIKYHWKREKEIKESYESNDYLIITDKSEFFILKDFLI